MVLLVFGSRRAALEFRLDGVMGKEKLTLKDESRNVADNVEKWPKNEIGFDWVANFVKFSILSSIYNKN